MEYTIPYFLVFFVLLILYDISKSRYSIEVGYLKPELSNANIYEVAALLVYLCFFGLRGYLFTDCFEYQDRFEETINDKIEWDYSDFLIEPAFLFCIKIIGLFTDDYFVFQFIWTIIDVVALFYILKNETGRYFLLSFALLIPFFEGVQVNLLRNIKGILIFYYAIRYIREQNLIKYLIAMAFGCMIHIGTFIFVPMYFFINRNLKHCLLGISLISIYLYFTNLSILNPIFVLLSSFMGGKVDTIVTQYLESTTSAGLTFGFFYRMFILIILLSKYDYLSRVNTIMLNTAILYVCCNTAFNSILVMRDRFSALFILGLVGIMPFIFESIRDNSIRKIIMAVNFVCILGFIYMPNSSVIAKYTNVITGIEKRSEAAARADEYFSNIDR